MHTSYTYLNNDFIKSDTASLPVADLSVQRGYAIFDFLRTYNNKTIFLDDHLERFILSANEMRLPVGKTKEQLKEIIRQIMQKNNLPNSGIRITLTGGNSADGYNIATPNLVITQQPLEPLSTEVFNKGIKLVSFQHQRQLPHVKTTDYLMAVWLQPYIKQKAADDVLYYIDNVISECPRANIFIVNEQDHVITPSSKILKGVIRKKLSSIISSKFQYFEKDILLQDLYSAKEVFITSTTKQILPVTCVDNAVINSGKHVSVTKELHSLLTKTIIEESE